MRARSLHKLDVPPLVNDSSAATFNPFELQVSLIPSRRRSSCVVLVSARLRLREHFIIRYGGAVVGTFRLVAGRFF